MIENVKKFNKEGREIIYLVSLDIPEKYYNSYKEFVSNLENTIRENIKKEVINIPVSYYVCEVSNDWKIIEQTKKLEIICSINTLPDFYDFNINLLEQPIYEYLKNIDLDNIKNHEYQIIQEGYHQEVVHLIIYPGIKEEIHKEIMENIYYFHGLITLSDGKNITRQFYKIIFPNEEAAKFFVKLSENL